MTKRLIDFYPELLTEASAGDEAKKRGLKSIGFGRYVDPSNPSKVIAKSKNGKLVSVGSGEKPDIGAAKKQVKNIEKRNGDYASRAQGAEKRNRAAAAERRGPGRKEDQRLLNKRQGNTLRKVFGKGIRLSKVTTAGGQRQMWWNVDETGIHNAAMNRKFQQWQANKLAKMKKAIASDPGLKGWVPVFQQDPHDGVHLVMVKE